MNATRILASPRDALPHNSYKGFFVFGCVGSFIGNPSATANGFTLR